MIISQEHEWKRVTFNGYRSYYWNRIIIELRMGMEMLVMVLNLNNRLRAVY